jgi:hypothetical protein
MMETRTRHHGNGAAGSGRLRARRQSGSGGDSNFGKAEFFAACYQWESGGGKTNMGRIIVA